MRKIKINTVLCYLPLYCGTASAWTLGNGKATWLGDGDFKSIFDTLEYTMVKYMTSIDQPPMTIMNFFWWRRGELPA